jgi:hypothetical protein
MLRFVVVAALAVAAVAPGPALAHGPCRCLAPREGLPGTKVHARYPLYKVIFNPDRTDLAIGPKSLWSLHHGGAPITVYRTTWRYSERPLNRGRSFVIPRAAPGRYLIALYDGGEGGQHYSWETFTVRKARPGTTTAPVKRTSSSGGVATGIFVAGILAALLTGLAGGILLRRKRRP